MCVQVVVVFSFCIAVVFIFQNVTSGVDWDSCLCVYLCNGVNKIWGGRSPRLRTEKEEKTRMEHGSSGGGVA